MKAFPINYMGARSILTNPLYLKWSLKTLEVVNSDKADLKNDLKAITANKDNVEIISYLCTLLRAVALLG